MEIKLLLRVKDAAEVMSLSEWQVRELIRKKNLRCTRVGRYIRVPRTAIEDYIDEWTQ